MKARLALAAVVVTSLSALAFCETSRTPRSAQTLDGYAVQPHETRARRRGPASGFFRWGFSVELGGIAPIGDDAFAMTGEQEFTPAVEVGGEMAFDVGTHFQASFIMRIGFGGVDDELYHATIGSLLGYEPTTARGTIIQSGLRLRAFLFDASHFRPFLMLETTYTTMGVNARQEVQSDDGSGDTERETVFSYRYVGVSLAPGAGLRYDVGLRARPGLPRYTRLLSIYLQASYSFNLWRVARLEVEGVEEGETPAEEMDLGHVRVSAGIGLMF